MREKHLFQFAANKIAEAARLEGAYHRERVRYWTVEQEKSLALVRETAKIEFREYDVTGGKRLDCNINYGDGAAYRRMQEAGQKIDNHRKAAERFETDAQIYGTQGERVYELETADVHYYRLGGGAREE